MKLWDRSRNLLSSPENHPGHRNTPHPFRVEPPGNTWWGGVCDVITCLSDTCSDVLAVLGVFLRPRTSAPAGRQNRGTGAEVYRSAYADGSCRFRPRRCCGVTLHKRPLIERGSREEGSRVMNTRCDESPSARHSGPGVASSLASNVTGFLVEQIRHKFTNILTCFINIFFIYVF